MAKLFFLTAALFLFTVYFHNVIEFNQDLGRHLLTGKIIWETRQVPLVNLYSYTYPNFPFINTHWLSEVIFFLLGVSRLVFFKTLVMLAATLLTLFTAWRYSKNLSSTAVSFAFLAPVLLERTEIRPEIFSFLFVAIFLYVLMLRPKLLWLLVPLEILWVNLHIYFILGPVLVAIFCLSQRRLTLPALFVFLAPFVNPNGFSGAIYPFRVFSNYGYPIVENQNLFFLKDAIFNPNIGYFAIGTVAFVVSFLLAGRRSLTVFNLLISSLAILSVIHIRSLPLLFFLELPIFAFNLGHLKRYSTAIVGAAIILTLWRGVRLASNDYYQTLDSHKRFGADITERGRGAVDFVLANHLSGPIFNDFDIGSYLDYRLYPQERVFVDGRPEAYPAGFFQKIYIPMQQSPANFAVVDKLIKFNLIIFSRTDVTPWGQQFLNDIVRNDKFTLAYIDEAMVIFVRKETYPQVSAVGVPPGAPPRILPAGLIFF